MIGEDQNHHLHDVIFSIPIAIIVALLSYRAHYASVFDYRTNHVYLPWSSSHRSLHPCLPEAIKPSSQPEQRGLRVGNPNNMTAVAWPRKEMTQDGNRDQASQMIPPGFSGAAEDNLALSSRQRTLRSERIHDMLHRREAAIRDSADRPPQNRSENSMPSTRSQTAAATRAASPNHGEPVKRAENRRSVGTIV